MNKKRKKQLLWLLDLALNILVIFFLVFGIQKWLIAPFKISGASMCDTLNVLDGSCQHSGFGERIIINEATYLLNDPERGDVVVMNSPNQEQDKAFIKRIIGMPGDTLKFDDGEVYVKERESKNFIMLDETYLNEDNKGKTRTYFSDVEEFEIPNGKYFLLGDNRKSSTDSRSCFNTSIRVDCNKNPENAFVGKSKIRGKAWVVWWPLENIRILKSHHYPELDSESLEEK